ncbi:MAG: hypothetical protein AAF368_13060, partial [Planctomycetota bacterium]
MAPPKTRAKPLVEPPSLRADLVAKTMNSAANDNRIGALLLPYQAEAVALSHEHDLLVVEKGRRTGLTYGFAADAVLTASAAEGGQDVAYITYAMDRTREFIDYCRDFLKAFSIVGESYEFTFGEGSDVERQIKAYRIDLPSGHKIIALSSAPRSVRGLQAKVILDEAAFQDDLDEMIKAVLALVIWGGSVVIISTHNGESNAFNGLIERIRAGRQKGHVFRITFDEAVAQGLYERIALVKGLPDTLEAKRAWYNNVLDTYAENADEELHCIPAEGSGVYFSSSVIRRAMSADHVVVNLTCPADFLEWGDNRAVAFMDDWWLANLKPLLDDFEPKRRSYFGQDFARSGDLSVLALGQHDAMLRLQVPAIVEMRNVPFREQFWLLDRTSASLPTFMCGRMDAAGNGAQLAEDMGRKWGAERIAAIKATETTYLEGYPKLKDAIERREIVIPQSDDVLT